MTGPDHHYVTLAMRTVMETRPVAAALEAFIRSARTDAAREARTVEALAIVDRLGQYLAFEDLTLEAAEEAPNVVGLFEHRARRANHPCMGDDAPPHGYPRPELGQSAEAAVLAREEHDHDVAMNRYWDGA